MLGKPGPCYTLLEEAAEDGRRVCKVGKEGPDLVCHAQEAFQRGEVLRRGEVFECGKARRVRPDALVSHQMAGEGDLLPDLELAATQGKSMLPAPFQYRPDPGEELRTRWGLDKDIIHKFRDPGKADQGLIRPPAEPIAGGIQPHGSYLVHEAPLRQDERGE